MSSTLLYAPPQAPVAVERLRRRPYLLLALLALWMLSGTYLVPPDEEAVVTRFGGIVEPRVTPGLHIALPWPIDRVYKLKVRQTRRLMIGGDPADGVLGRMQPSQSQFITGDQNLIQITVVAQYSVGDPANFLFRAESVPAVITGIIESELAVRAGHTRVDDILTTEKIAIQNAIRRNAQKALDVYESGIVLASINIDKAIPPAEAAEAFRDVASARADAIRTVNEAQGYTNDLIPRARGEAAQILETARAYKESKVNHARGDADRFLEVAAEYAKAPEVTSRRAYVEAMEQILPKIRKLIVDGNESIDLTLVRKGESAEPKK